MAKLYPSSTPRGEARPKAPPTTPFDTASIAPPNGPDKDPPNAACSIGDISDIDLPVSVPPLPDGPSLVSSSVSSEVFFEDDLVAA